MFSLTYVIAHFLLHNCDLKKKKISVCEQRFTDQLGNSYKPQKKKINVSVQLQKDITSFYTFNPVMELYLLE